MKEQITEVVRNLIYHGRHFSAHRDEVVIRKSVDYLLGLKETRRKPKERTIKEKW